MISVLPFGLSLTSRIRFQIVFRDKQGYNEGLYVVLKHFKQTGLALNEEYKCSEETI